MFVFPGIVKFEDFRIIQQTSDQGYILQGYDPEDGNSQIYLEKVYGNFNTPSAIEELNTNKTLIKNNLGK